MHSHMKKSATSRWFRTLAIAATAAMPWCAQAAVVEKVHPKNPLVIIKIDEGELEGAAVDWTVSLKFSGHDDAVVGKITKVSKAHDKIIVDVGEVPDFVKPKLEVVVTKGGA